MWLIIILDLINNITESNTSSCFVPFFPILIMISTALGTCLNLRGIKRFFLISFWCALSSSTLMHVCSIILAYLLEGFSCANKLSNSYRSSSIAFLKFCCHCDFHCFTLEIMFFPGVKEMSEKKRLPAGPVTATILYADTIPFPSFVYRARNFKIVRSTYRVIIIFSFFKFYHAFDFSAEASG